MSVRLDVENSVESGPQATELLGPGRAVPAEGALKARQSKAGSVQGDGKAPLVGVVQNGSQVSMGVKRAE